MMKDSVNNAFKSRSIVEMRRGLTASENDIFDILFSYINKDDDPDNLIYTLVIDDFKEKFGLKYAKNAYKKVRDGVVGLKGKTIDIWPDDGKKFNSFVLFQSIQWDYRNGRILVKVGEDIKKLFLAQKQSAPYYEVRYTLPMNSKYSKLLYVMFKEWLKTGVRYDQVEVLRDKLQVPESYKYSMFKQRVLDASLKEINETTDISVSYEEKKKSVRGGQKVIGLSFKIRKKECVTDMIEQEGGQMILDYLGSKNVHGVTLPQAAIIYQAAQKIKLTDRQIKNRINIVLENHNIKSMVGYLIFAMSDRFETPKAVRAGFQEFKQRRYTEEWFQLLEKNLICPERMTDEEQMRFQELTSQENRQHTV